MAARKGAEKCLRCRGAALVEFALVAPLFFLLVFGVIEFGRIFFVQLTLQHAVREAGRFAVTGRHLTDSDPSRSGRALSRLESIRKVTRDSAMGLQLAEIQIISGTQTNVTAGGPGQTVTIALTYRVGLITPLVGRFFENGEYAFTVSTTFKNEPFPPGQTE